MIEQTKENKKKNKILLLSDFQLATSGVGIQSKVLIDGLIKTGKYSFICLGGAIRHENYSTIKVNDDFIIKPVDGFGTKELIRQILATEHPDAIFLFTDPRQFLFIWEMEEEIHQMCPIVYWTIWDEAPYCAFNSVLYESTDLLNCISDLTYNLISPNFPDKTKYIPHAFPKNMHYPLSKDKILTLRQQHFGDKKDWFIALWVNRNAHRKVPSDVMESWKIFLDDLQTKEGHKNAVLIMHTDPTDQEGPNLFAVADMLDITQNVWFSPHRIGTEEMNTLYNMSDVCINISKNEGFGLSCLISMQCGKPVIALKTGGMTRQVVDYRDGSEHGVAIEPCKKILVGSQMVPYIYECYADQKDVANAFYKIYKMSDQEKETLAKKMSDYIDHEFNYDKMISDWDKTLDDCITKWKNKQLPANKRWNLLEINPKPLTPVGLLNQPSQTPHLNIHSSQNKPMPMPAKKPIDIASLIKARTERKQ